MTKIDNQTRGLLIEVAKAAIQEYEQQRVNRVKIKVDNRLRNIKLLLKNYRRFEQHVEEAKQDIPELLSALSLDEISEESFEIKSILANKKRTAAMLAYVKHMLGLYKELCDKSTSPEEQNRYSIIYDLYLSKEKKTVEEVAKLHFLAKRTVYYNVDQACKALAVLMFGVDGVKFEEV